MDMHLEIRRTLNRTTRTESSDKQALLQRVARVIAADPRGAMKAFDQVSADTHVLAFIILALHILYNGGLAGISATVGFLMIARALFSPV